MIDFGWPQEDWVDDHMAVPVESGVGEGGLDQFLDRVALPGGEHIGLGGILLKHQPHRPDIVASKAAVALGVKVA